MKILKNKIDTILKSKGLTRYKISVDLDCSKSALNQMARGDIPFSDEMKEKLAPILEVSIEEFNSWIIADEYPKAFIEKLISIHKNRKDKGENILAQNINGLLAEKDLSQTDFAKIIKYDQSAINKMINGKISLSDRVLNGLSEVLEIPAEDIQAWNIADKYSIKTLEMALGIKED